MTSRYQQSRAGGRQAYNRFCARVDRVDVSGVRATPPGTVQATITYHYRGDRVVEERTSYRLVEQDGILKIDDSTVLSSSTQWPRPTRRADRAEPGVRSRGRRSAAVSARWWGHRAASAPG